LFDEGGGTVYCDMHASNAPDNPRASTLDFNLIQGSFGFGAVIRSSGKSHAIEAPEISFSSDGFHTLTVSTKSFFNRMLTDAMANAAAAKLDADQWEKLWQTFRHSGVVTVHTAFAAPRG
jgi:hypothetical protein